jgi:hypothetical protein
MIYRGPGFLADTWFGSTTTPLPSVRKTKKERQLADERMGAGVGEEPNPTTARKPSPLYLIQYFGLALKLNY